MRAAKRADEADRISALRRYQILDTPREPEFDEVPAALAELCDAPISVINLIDDARQWFKAEIGLGVRETPLESSICAHAILEQDYLEVPDTLEDPRFKNNPLCLQAPKLRFYAGALLKTPEGSPIGTLCVLDTRPRRLSPTQARMLRMLARQVMAQLELRLALRRSELARREVDHRVRNSLSLVASVLRLQGRDARPEARAALEDARRRVEAVAQVHDQIHRADQGGAVEAAALLRGLAETLQATAPHGVTVAAGPPPRLSLSADQAARIGVLVNELVTNALRHAFPDDRGGAVTVTLEPLDHAMRLRVEDDGVGLRGPFDPYAGGLGLKVAASAAEALGGPLRHAPRPGGGSRFEAALKR